MPEASAQKSIVTEKMKERRESLEKLNNNLRQKQTLKSSAGPKVSKDSLLKIMRDVDN